MAWPFIAMIMTQSYPMSPIAIGVAMTSNAAIKLITLILVTNACAVLVFQTFIMRFLAQINLPKRILLGGAIFAFSQLCFFAERSTDMWVWLTLTGAGVFICTALLSLLLCAIIYACRINMVARLQDS